MKTTFKKGDMVRIKASGKVEEVDGVSEAMTPPVWIGDRGYMPEELVLVAKKPVVSYEKRPQVQVIIKLFQGVVDEVWAFDSEEKALQCLCHETGEDFKTAEEFGAWKDEIAEGDSKEEYRWFHPEIE